MDKLRDHHVQHEVAEGRPDYRESRWERAVKVVYSLMSVSRAACSGLGVINYYFGSSQEYDHDDPRARLGPSAYYNSCPRL